MLALLSVPKWYQCVQTLVWCCICIVRWNLSNTSSSAFFFFFFGRRENTIRLVRWATGIFFFFLNSKTMLVGSFICDLGNLAHSADEQWFYLITVCSFEPQMFLQRKRVWAATVLNGFLSHRFLIVCWCWLLTASNVRIFSMDMEMFRLMTCCSAFSPLLKSWLHITGQVACKHLSSILLHRS